MLVPRDEIISDIETQIKRKDGDYSDGCVGVAKDSREPFFEAHLVEDRNDGFLYREAFTPGCAREIRDHFIIQRGAAVDPCSGDEGRLVYAYRMTPLKPSARIKKSCFALGR